MTQQIVNIGTSENKGDGDPLRTAFQKINENFTELYNPAPTTSTIIDIKGSVFGDDSTLLVDGANNLIPSSVIQGSEANNWTEAYGWGDHSAAGYLTSFTETDPIFTASPAATITNTNISNWNTAYGWGDHSIQGYLTTETDPVVGVVNGIVKADGAGNISAAVAGTDYSTVTSLNDLSDVDLSTNPPYKDYMPLVWDSLGNEWYPGENLKLGGFLTMESNSTIFLMAGGQIRFEGSTTDGFDTILDLVNPTANRTVRLPDADGTIALLTDLPTDVGDLTDTGGLLGGGGGTADNSITWTLTNNSTISWVFSGPGIETGNTNDPELQLIRGYTYKFNNTVAISHPFEIRTEDGGSAYTAGISKVGDVTTFTVPYDAPDVLVYQCTSHSTMLGTIKIVNANNSLQSRTNVSASAYQVPGVALNRDITGFKGYNLYKITTNIAARVIVYTSAAARTADAGRTEGTDPASDAGVIAEVVTTGAETITLSPGVIGYNNEDPVTNIIPIKVTNKTGSPATTTVTLTVVQTEV